MRPALCLLLLLAGHLVGAPEDLRALLDRYVGRWVGTFTVTRHDGAVLQTLRVEQQYWWEGDEHRGIGVYDRQGELTWVSSRSFFRGGALLCEISVADEPPRTYAARLRGDTIIWLPTNVLEATHKQIRETIVQRDGKQVLISDGVEQIGPPENRIPVRIVGELERVP